MRTFLLNFNTSVVPRQRMVEHLDTLRDVLNWLAFGEAGILLVSNAGVSQLSGAIHNAFPDLYFVVAEVLPKSIDGWQPKVVWDLITSPKSSGRWPA